MLAIITPAKGMNEEKIILDIKTSTPRFLDMSEKVMKELKDLEIPHIATLIKVNDSIAQTTFIRCQDWEVFNGIDKKAAVLSFSGEVYRGMNPQSFDRGDLEFLNTKLRILSGLYGSLKPMDGMMPYRLEMGTKLSVEGSKDLYDFWSETLTNSILDDVKSSGEEVLINLASNEYVKVLKIKNKIRIINIIFKERKGLKYRTVVVHTKKARGMMINYIVKNRIEDSKLLKNFNEEGYEFSDELSDDNNFVFTRDAI